MVQAVDRAIAILFSFASAKRALSVAEIAEVANLNRTTVHRLLGTVERHGLVQRIPDGNRYHLGPRLLQLSGAYLQFGNLQTAAISRLTLIRDETEETAALHLRQGCSRVVAFQVESHRELRRTYPDIGEPIALDVGAPSRAILAFMDPEEVSTCLEAGLSELWTSKEALDAELSQIRTRGYAVSFQERSDGVVSVAAPVFDHFGNPIASINLSGPVTRINDEWLSVLADAVVGAGASLSHDLGYVSDKEVQQ